MSKNFIISSIFVGAILLAISGCARNISSSTYDAQKLGAANETYECIVVSARRVAVEEGDYLENNHTGALVGGILGGVAGNAIGKGHGRTAATAVGAIAGGFGGAMAEKAVKSQDGMEYVVRLRSGAMRTVVQGLDNPLYVGQTALLMIDNYGRSRVVPTRF